MKNVTAAMVVAAILIVSGLILADDSDASTPDGVVYYERTLSNGMEVGYFDAPLDGATGQYQAQFTSINGELLGQITVVASDTGNRVSGGAESILGFDGTVEYTIFKNSTTEPVATGSFVATAISFNAGTGGSGQMDDVVAGGYYLLPQNGFNPDEGYSFEAWSINGTEHAPGTYVVVTANMEVTAIFKENTTPSVETTVSFAPETEGTGSFEITPERPVTVDVGTAIVANSNVLTIGDYTITAVPAERYEFSYWEYEGTSVTENMTVKAVFIEKEPVVPTDVVIDIVAGNGGSVDRASVTVPEGTTVTASGSNLGFSDGTNVVANASAPTEAYTYRFGSWTIEGQEMVDGTPVTVTDGMTITANFVQEDRVYTVTFHNGSQVYDTQKVVYNGLATEPADDPSMDRYTFDGWFTAPTGGSAFDFSTPVTGDLDLYAQFTEVVTPVYYEVTITQNEHIVAITVTDSDGKVIEDGDSVLSGTRLTVNLQIEDGYQVYGGNSYTVRATGEVTIAPVAVAEIDVTVVPGEHGSASLGSLVLTSSNTWTATIVLDSDRGYRANVSFVPEGTYNYEVNSNGNIVITGLTADLTVNVTFEQIPVTDDDDDDYVPPVVVVPKGDDDTTTYIVAIAAAAVVAILAALILMQSRKS